MGPLDREIGQSYQLNITAKDGGRNSLSGSMLLSISVLDINDNPPVFNSGGQYYAKVNESVTPGSYVIKVRADDKDVGDNSRLSYSIISNSVISDQFNIDEETGVITTNKPLKCKENICNVVVVAKDHGSPKKHPRPTLRFN